MTDAEKITAYLDGYGAARMNKAGALAWAHLNGQNGNTDRAEYWRAEGIFDGASGGPSRFAVGQTQITPQNAQQPTQQAQQAQQQAPVTNLPAGMVRQAPKYTPKGGPTTPVAAPGAALPQGAPVRPSYQESHRWERYGPEVGEPRYLELACYRFGKLAPYDSVVNLQRALDGSILSVASDFLIRFELLGDDPGEQREGYRISGPLGPFARLVRRAIARGDLNPNPRAYQLSDWVGTRMSSGQIKFIGHQELSRLGLYTEL